MASRATAHDYAQTILLHSRTTPDLSLFPGHNYRTLANFLYQPYAAPTKNGSVALSPQTQHKPLVVLYKYTKDGVLHQLQYEPTPAGLENLDTDTAPACDAGKVLFFNGFVPPEWLNLIGSRYRVDPEFFRQHLRFMQPERQLDLPGLYSTSRNIIRLPLISIGTWTLDQPLRGRGSLAQQRSIARDKTRSYLKGLGATTPAGQSIVRGVMVNDEAYFTVEQELNICVETKDGGWTALCWLDGDLDLDATVFNPTQQEGGDVIPRQSHWILPTYLHRPKIALVGPALVEPHPVGNQQPWRGYASISKLYGRLLDPYCAHQDPFYALTELFAISAFSVNQGLNLIEQCMDSQTTTSISDMQASLENLRQAKAFVRTQMSQLQTSLGFIETQGPAGAKWPRATAAKQRELITAAATELSLDYSHLHKRATTLLDRIGSESEWLMHRAMLNESQRAFSQGSRVARLTFLAFLFIPLSFTSSVFGMNVVEFVGRDQADLSIWSWVVLSVAVFSGSLLLWWWEGVQRHALSLQNRFGRGTARADHTSKGED
ncbi:hypothetical protein BJX68DRAFT_270336 [Aspergillus pseudodeflectus]|uniref:Uncharacterized protein n=1 Tax=Aspergillus pseudodeflectus TaxID=176178 RepID=A0ABR4JSJ3_9EURO